MLGTGSRVFISEKADNNDILLLGRSGSGKTCALWQIEQNLAKNEAAVLVLNFSGTHDLMPRCAVRWIDVKREGYPLSLFHRIPLPHGGIEDSQDMEDAVLDIFKQVVSLPVRQITELRKAIHAVAEQPEMWHDGIAEVGRLLEQSEEEPAKRVFEKYRPFFSRIRFSAQQAHMISPGVITVFDFGRFAPDVQVFLTEMTLAIIWRHFRIWGQYAQIPLFIAMDEFQNLKIRPHTVFAQMMREGRKFHLALLLATQTMETFAREERAVISQAATRLYFRPTYKDVKNMGGECALHHKIKNLQRGDCLAVGNFLIGTLLVQKTVKMTFREGEPK